MNDIPPLALPLPADLTRHEALICMWIGSDPPLLEQMRLLVEGDEFEYDDDELAATVVDMLYDPAYGRQLPDLNHLRGFGGDVVAKAASLRASVPLRALDAIDPEGWARIRAALLAGTEN